MHISSPSSNHLPANLVSTHTHNQTKNTHTYARIHTTVSSSPTHTGVRAYSPVNTARSWGPSTTTTSTPWYSMKPASYSGSPWREPTSTRSTWSDSSYGSSPRHGPGTWEGLWSTPMVVLGQDRVPTFVNGSGRHTWSAEDFPRGMVC
jgi:hypothetical protein